jgi:hypothetical protein
MGPNSVVFTWCEGVGEDGDETDDVAEGMVLHPELVVLPYVEPEPSLFSSEEEEETENIRPDKNTDRHRRKKATKPKSKLLETRTMVVLGAVLVLGVSMAVYGIRASTHGHGGWKKLVIGGRVGGLFWEY